MQAGAFSPPCCHDRWLSLSVAAGDFVPEPLDVESCLYCSVVGVCFRSGPGTSWQSSSSPSFSGNGVLRRRPNGRKDRQYPPFRMPARVLRLRGVAVPLWSNHSSAESRRQLAPFPPRQSGAGHGGGSIGPRHDLAAACRWRHLVRARRQFRRPRDPRTPALDCRLHDRRSGRSVVRAELVSEGRASPPHSDDRRLPAPQ